MRLGALIAPAIFTLATVAAYSWQTLAFFTAVGLAIYVAGRKL